jgi:hypothetical protein
MMCKAIDGAADVTATSQPLQHAASADVKR